MQIWKYPAQTGKFFGDLKIVAGHVGTAEIARDPTFHSIFFDGQSHYYIDGSVQRSGVILELKADTNTGKFYAVTDRGEYAVYPHSYEHCEHSDQLL